MTAASARSSTAGSASRTPVPLNRKETANALANFKVPAGTLDDARKKQIVDRTTDLYAEIYGERARPTTLVLVEEVPDGGWGIGGHVLTVAMLAGGEEADEGA